MKRKLSLQERAARASDRLASRGHSRVWDNAHDGYLAGYRAAKREMRTQIWSLQKEIAELFLRVKDERSRAERLEIALRSYARDAIDETRPHPFKELHP